MDLSKMSPPKGSRKSIKRVGRGESSGHGKTCCRGGKGQKGRKGATIRPGFEGGQKPLYRRLPKLGFISRQKVRGTNQFAVFNVADLEKFESGTSVTPALLLGTGRGSISATKVKILGDGPLTKKISVKAHAVSASAKALIEKAGGSVELLGAQAQAAA